LSDNSYTNLQIRTTDAYQVRDAMDMCDIGSAKLMARPEVPYVSVYPFLTEDDFGYLKQVTEKMSNRLQVHILAIMVPTSAVFKYALFLGDKLLDEYNSEHPQSGGKADLLLRLCVAGTTKKDLQEFLHPLGGSSNEHAGDRMAMQMAEFLGIPRAQVCTGYNHLKWAQANRQ
jgi:hypothetical protein